MSEFLPEEHFSEVMDYVEDMGLITPWEEVEKYYMDQADDEKPYCMADDSQGLIHVNGEYESLTEAAFYMGAYKLYTDVSIEFTVMSYIYSSDAEDLDTLLEEVDPTEFSFEYYLEDCLRWESGFHFLVKDSYTVRNSRAEKNIEENIKKLGKMEKADYNLEKLEEALNEFPFC